MTSTDTANAPQADERLLYFLDCRGQVRVGGAANVLYKRGMPVKVLTCTCPAILMLAFTRSFAKSQVQSFRPLFDRILIERITVPPKTNSGLIIPEALKGKHNEGVVLAVGDGVREKDGNYTPLSIKVGDRVVLGEWAGNEVKLDGKDYIILREDDILGILP